MSDSKKCCHCKQIKSKSDFWKDKTKEDGLHHNCKSCGSKMSKKSYKNKREEWGKKYMPHTTRTPEEQKKVLVERAADYRKRRLVLQPDYRAVNWRRQFARKIGISSDIVEQYYKKQFMKQQAHCAICGRITEELCIDHNHRKQGVESLRALLCKFCNVAISWFDDNADACENASTYLRKYS